MLGKKSATWIFAADAAVKDAEDYSLQLFDNLDSFLHYLTIGEFKARLKLLKSMAHQRQAEEEQGLERAENSDVDIFGILDNLVSFYTPLIGILDASLQQRRAPIEKKLKDHTKMSKWDSQSYYSLRESSEKSHRALFGLMGSIGTFLERE